MMYSISPSCVWIDIGEDFKKFFKDFKMTVWQHWVLKYSSWQICSHISHSPSVCVLHVWTVGVCVYIYSILYGVWHTLPLLDVLVCVRERDSLALPAVWGCRSEINETHPTLSQVSSYELNSRSSSAHPAACSWHKSFITHIKMPHFWGFSTFTMW